MNVDLEALQWKHRHDGWLADPQMEALFAEVRALRAERDALKLDVLNYSEKAGETVYWKERAAELERAGRELYDIADSVNPATYRMELEAWRKAVRG